MNTGSRIKCWSLALGGALLMIPSAASAQSTLEEMIELIDARSTPNDEVAFQDAFKPDTVFRGKPLMDWLIQLRDADIEATAYPAKKVFLAMGDNAVPFLLRAADRLEWNEVEFAVTPMSICEEMEEKALDRLVQLLESEHGLSSWMVLTRIISRTTPWVGMYSPTQVQLDEAELRLERIKKALQPCLGSSDAFTRYAAVQLLDEIASHQTTIEWGTIPSGARRLMDGDPRNEVRGAACLLLVSLGLRGVNDGLAKEELEVLLKDSTLPAEVRRAVAMGWFRISPPVSG